MVFLNTLQEWSRDRQYSTQCEQLNDYCSIYDMDLESFEVDMSQHGEGEIYTRIRNFEPHRFPNPTVSFSWPLDPSPRLKKSPKRSQKKLIQELFLEPGVLHPMILELAGFNTPDEGIITLAGAQGLASWAPRVGTTGEYLFKIRTLPRNV